MTCHMNLILALPFYLNDPGFDLSLLVSGLMKVTLSHADLPWVVDFET